jgi:hypothetical protein
MKPRHSHSALISEQAPRTAENRKSVTHNGNIAIVASRLFMISGGTMNDTTLTITLVLPASAVFRGEKPETQPNL